MMSFLPWNDLIICVKIGELILIRTCLIYINKYIYILSMMIWIQLVKEYILYLKKNVSSILLYGNYVSWQALTFFECKYLTVNNLKIQEAQQIHTSFEKCMNVQASLLTITAPEDSPNTDGIHVAGTQDIQISSCNIGTGIPKVSFFFFAFSNYFFG